ncbi:hypothetical protein D1007_20796 [Hordeum vulgare]|nr:hypothetical protein D1007_20796 [Hordeum vulgare]
MQGVTRDDCCKGPVWVVVALTPRSDMFLMWGWKSFTRSRGLGFGHLLQCRFDGTATPIVKFSGVSDVHLECCTESSSGSDYASSRDKYGDVGIFGIKQEDFD